MPEGPEVSWTALYLNHRLQGKKIKSINVNSGRYSKKGKSMSGLKDVQNVLPLKVISVNNKGKFIWMGFEDKNGDKQYMMNKLLMSGSWDFEEHDHSHVEFTLTDGTKLWFTDQRNFGEMVFTKKKKAIDTYLEGLAPDFIQTAFTNQEFHDRIKKLLYNGGQKISTARQKWKIIKVLMEQKAGKALGSGIGNYLVAEMLYHAKLTPHKTLYTIYRDRKLSDRLANSIRYMMKLAFLVNSIGYMGDLDKQFKKFIKDSIPAFKKKYIPSIKLKKDDVFVFNVYQNKEDDDVVTEKIVGNRTAWFNPKVQK